MKINNLIKIPADGKKDNSFIGIKIKDNKVEFHYPETFVLSEDNDLLRKDILAILRTISLSKTITRDLSSYNSKYTNNNEYLFPLNSYLWIINDYLVTGRYDNKEKNYIHSIKGKINWKRTLRNNPAITNGNVVYTDVISERNDQKDNLLTESYKCCVKQAMDNIGWLYGLTIDSDGLDLNKLFEIKRKQYLNAIRNELSKTFNDSKKIRLLHMKNIITGLNDSMLSSKEIIYGVDSYDYVFERMVDKMFSKVENIREFYPSASWDLKLEKNELPSSKLRPDTVVINDRKVYILDSKYYRYGVTFRINDIPETTSIQKQITYGEYIKKMKQGIFDDVYSAFVMPYSSKNNIHKDIYNKELEFVGIATAKWYDNNNANNRRIVGILIDTNFLVNNWIKKDEDNVNNIINIIEKNVQGLVR